MKHTDDEKHALVAAASAFAYHGVDLRMPWEGNLDEREQEFFNALVRACRRYHERMNNADRT